MIYLTVFTCTVLAMIIGSLWYGPIFGKRWMALNNLPELSTDPAIRKEQMRHMYPAYIIQFLLSFFQVFILYTYIDKVPEFSGVENALLMCLAFIVPTLATSGIWSGDSRSVQVQKFLIQTGYSLIAFIVFGAVLGL